MRHMRLVQTENNGTIGIQNITTTKGLIFIYAIGLHKRLGNVRNINCLNIFYHNIQDTHKKRVTLEYLHKIIWKWTILHPDGETSEPEGKKKCIWNAGAGCCGEILTADVYQITFLATFDSRYKSVSCLPTLCLEPELETPSECFISTLCIWWRVKSGLNISSSQGVRTRG